MELKWSDRLVFDSEYCSIAKTEGVYKFLDKTAEKALGNWTAKKPKNDGDCVFCEINGGETWFGAIKAIAVPFGKETDVCFVCCDRGWSIFSFEQGKFLSSERYEKIEATNAADEFVVKQNGKYNLIKNFVPVFEDGFDEIRCAGDFCVGENVFKAPLGLSYLYGGKIIRVGFDAVSLGSSSFKNCETVWFAKSYEKQKRKLFTKSAFRLLSRKTGKDFFFVEEDEGLQDRLYEARDGKLAKVFITVEDE